MLHSNPSRIGVLDSLRGVAALGVSIYHFTTAHTVPAFSSPTLNLLFAKGYLGVDVFFVISGFIIPYSLWNTSYKTRYFFLYMIKRLIRICPPAYISLLLVSVLWALIGLLSPHSPSQFATLSAVRLFRNLTFTYYFLHPGWLNSVFWTLGIELKFYAFIGIFFPLLFNSSKLFYFTILFLIVSAGYFFLDSYDHGSFALNSLFALGGATLLYIKKRVLLNSYLLFVLLFGGISFFTIGFDAALAGIITSLIIAFVHIEKHVLNFFGKISYSLYLTHLPIGSIASILLSRFLHPTTELQNASIILLILFISCTFAYIFSELIEKPFLLYARRIPLFK